MVLDQSVMNVSISQLVADFDTDVSTIQGVITLYSLVMAMFMLTGGKIADILGRRRTFVVGLVIYACGSALTAAAPTVVVLALGWSVLEGLGAALVLPAMVALVAGNYEGSARKVAYAVIGGVAGAGIAVGPIVGGWATTELSWRVVFVAEVVIVIGVLVMTPAVRDVPITGATPRLDGVGTFLAAAGLGTIVFATLQSSSWGWVQPKDPPFEPFGMAPTLFVIALGAVLLWGFFRWQRYRERTGTDPLVHLDLLRIAPLRAGLIGMFSQNLILMAVFFTIPLYLQLVLGLNALETGVRMLPVSIAMFVASAVGSRLSARFAIRSIVRAGLSLIGVASLLLLATVQPALAETTFAIAMAVLGVGMGLMASQLGLVVQSSVDASGRSEAGGLQYTGQQLGSAIGVALIGGVVLASLTGSFVDNVVEDPNLDQAVVERVIAATASGVDFVPTDTVESAALEAGLPPAQAEALAADYADAQLFALKTGLLAAALLALVALAFTANLPTRVSDGSEDGADHDMTGAPVESAT
jgi:MFS family permease